VAPSPIAACEDAEVLVILTEWSQFVDVDPVAVGNVMKKRNVVDARNLLEKSKWVSSGFEYVGVGR
jgi:UDPglucose 6-dehydrogenase